jgi:endonuclease/exonuclease/phosphatase family metal-dependent hydrolase
MTPQHLRIVTWNCRDGTFAERVSRIQKFRPDIAIFQEIPDPGKQDDGHCIWVPSRLTRKKGVAVISSDKLTLSPIERPENLPEIFLPVKVRGRTDFNLLAVWTQKEKNYIESFEPILSTYGEFLKSAPSVIAGDFNSNTQWDRLHRNFPHTQLVDILNAEFGLISAYHQHRKEKQGEEKEKTFFMYYHEDKPYHIDYCFTPRTWAVDSVRIGTHAEWCTADGSDHCPLIVDLITG